MKEGGVMSDDNFAYLDEQTKRMNPPRDP